jgi:hypothetical protein
MPLTPCKSVESNASFDKSDYILPIFRWMHIPRLAQRIPNRRPIALFN